MARIAGGGGPQTGLYGTFTSTNAVVYAVNTNGWPGIAAVAGMGQSSSPYPYPLIYNGQTVDQLVEDAYQYASFWWLSFWTVSGPSSTTLSAWYDAGYVAGQEAGRTVMNAANTLGYVPASVLFHHSRAHGNKGNFVCRLFLCNKKRSTVMDRTRIEATILCT